MYSYSVAYNPTGVNKLILNIAIYSTFLYIVFNFIYFVQSDEASGDIILDFSSMGGPSYSIKKPKNGQLLVIPGWIPYRISKNKTEKDNILITGMYS